MFRFIALLFFTTAGCGSSSSTSDCLNSDCPNGFVCGPDNLCEPLVGLENITISPDSPRLASGTTVALTATAGYSDGTSTDVTSEVTWTVADDTIATVSDGGALYGVSAGEVALRAELSGIDGSTIATITDATLTSLSVSPPNLTTPLGTTADFTAMATFSDGTTQDLTATATWSSSDETVATIAGGSAASVGIGTATITAEFDGATAIAELEVTEARLDGITMSPGSLSLPAGTTGTLAVTANYSDGTTTDVTAVALWTTSDQAVATVTAGVVSAAAVGSATVTASFDGMSTDAPVDVTMAELVSLEVAPMAPDITVGEDIQLTATGIYTDASTQDVTSQAVWSTSAPTIAAVSGGVVSGLAVGDADITASVGALSATETVSVDVACDTCQSLGYNCGEYVDNGCGAVLNCGFCTAPESCGGNDTFGTCGTSSWTTRWLDDTFSSYIHEAPDGSIHIVTRKWAGLNIHSLVNGVWSMRNVGSGDLIPNDIKVTPNGDFHITYSDLDSYEYYMHVSGTTETISVVGNTDYYACHVGVDSTGEVHLLCSDTHDGLRHIRRSPAGVVLEDTVIDPFGNGGVRSVRIDADDRVNVAYRNYTVKDLQWGRRWSGSWSFQTVASAGDIAIWYDMDLDAQGQPHFVYQRWDTKDVFYATRTFATWHREPIMEAAEAGYFASIDIDASGVPHVTFNADQGAGNAVFYGRRDPAGWVLHNIYNRWGSYTDIAMGTDASVIVIKDGGHIRVATPL